MTENRLNVLIADDHRIIREGLKSLLNDEPGIEVVGEADGGRAAVRLAAELAPDVVVMDVSMPDLNGIEATRQITAAGDGAPQVVGLSAYSDRRLAIEMLNAGAAAFVSKTSACDELTEAIRAAAVGKVYLSPSVAGGVVEGFRRGAGAAGVPTAFTELSPREREILQLTSEGLAMKQIAMALQISIKTVETHRRNLMEKLNLGSVAELTKYAIREGLTTV
jgi:DNA-binding NarL/FixJ family response regulator